MEIYCQNVNGLRTKTSQILRAVSESDVEIFMMTETNLDGSMMDNEIFTDDFMVFRNDRNENNNINQKHSGGGVLIAVARAISSERVTIRE